MTTPLKPERNGPTVLKKTVAAIVACLYVGLSAWLVRSEGRSFRASLSRARPAQGVTESRAHNPDTPAKQPPDVAAAPEPAPERSPTPEPEARPPEQHGDLAAGPGSAHSPTAPASEHSKPKHGGQGKGKSKQASPEPPRVAMHEPAIPKPGEAREAEAGHAKLDPFWNEPEVQKKWDLAKLDGQEEMRLGAAIHEMILRFNPPAREGMLQERVFKAAKPILQRTARKDIRYNFTILDSNDVNAFSHTGGHVYLSRGMIAFIGEEDAVLQFVLAHEIAHVDHQDMLQCLRDPGVENVKMSTLEKVYFLILPLGYLDQQEFAADQWAYRQLIALDHTRYETLKFLRKLKGYAAEHELSAGRVGYKPRQDASPVQNHLWANTAAWRRLDELETFVNQASTKSQ